MVSILHSLPAAARVVLCVKMGMVCRDEVLTLHVPLPPQQKKGKKKKKKGRHNGQCYRTSKGRKQEEVQEMEIRDKQEQDHRILNHDEFELICEQ